VEILYVLIPLGLMLVACGLWAFFWATGNGQFDDLDSPGWSVLDDDAPPRARPGATAAPPEGSAPPPPEAR
jgi:cbb3-type cytochrome oxidase maturation protein